MGTRGELRIHLGAAPGVGKTYAMLGEARRRAGRGTDVVVGLVETHGRPRTAELLEGLEVLPRRRVEHRGVALTELDVDAVLQRSPQVVLVDELAHTNAPGSRHAKRWQDVQDILDAGIQVLTTVNVQHLESLNDVVERITGVRQRETVPDEVVRRAEQVELVDITPEALRRRMAHGNVYRPEKVDAALADYFRPANLTALRELALLWLADQVDIALQRHRTDPREVWETRERVVVALTGGPESETVLRRAARIARRAGSADLLVVHVLRGDGLPGAPATALVDLRRLADDVGASFHTVVGDDVPAALLDFARAVNATQLVLGTSRRSRLARVFVEGIGPRAVQASGPIDVHLVTHAEAGRGLRVPNRTSAVPLGRRGVGWSLGVALPAIITAVGFAGREIIGPSTDVVLLLLATVVAALVGGLGPALLAALTSGLLFNFFFSAPLYTLAVADPSDVITMVVLILVAVLVALVVDRAARRAQQAAAANSEAALLASFSRTVLTRPDPLPRLLEKVQQAFGLSAVALLERRDGRWETSASAGPGDCCSPGQADVDIAVDPDVHLVARGRAVPASDRRLLEAVAGQALLALRNRQMAAEAAHARRQAETTRLRTGLLAALGHDLRTPLTSIKAAAGTLRDAHLDLSDPDRRDLAATVEESADRLTALVANLLDSSRIATGAVVPDLHPVGYDEVAVLAVGALDRPDVGPGAILIDVDDGLPEVLADAGLLERVVVNIVDNALRHGGAPVVLRGSAHADQVELRIVDHGPGVPAGASTGLFAPFQRLGDRDGGGLGLGLSVARGFTEAMGGTLDAEDTPGRGLTVVIALPAAAPATPGPPR